jgi:hypothetical protein
VQIIFSLTVIINSITIYSDILWRMFAPCTLYSDSPDFQLRFISFADLTKEPRRTDCTLARPSLRPSLLAARDRAQISPSRTIPGPTVRSMARSGIMLVMLEQERWL